MRRLEDLPIIGRGVSTAIGVSTGIGDRGLHIFFCICTGMLANMLALAALGLSGHFTLSAVAATAVVMLVPALSGKIRAPGRLSALQRWGTGIPSWSVVSAGSPVLRWELATLVVLLLLCVVVSLHPPGHWDDTMYQLPLARHYVDHQAVVLHEYLRFPLFPQHENMLFALGIMLGEALQPHAGVGAEALWRFGAPEVLAQMLATLPLFIMALGLWAASHRYMGLGIPGLIAGLMLFMIGPVKSTLGFAYVDNALALYCWAAALAVAGDTSSAAARPQFRKWLLAGLLAGAACGIKYFGVVYATGLGIIVIVLALVQSRSVRCAAHAALAYAAAVAVAGGLWYVRSYLISGDPAHPAGASLFGFFLWNEGDLAWQHAEQALHGVRRSPVLLPIALREAGVLLWLPALAGLLIRRLPGAIRVLQAVFVGYLVFWFIVTQVPRYLAPIYGLGGFLSLHALWCAWHWAGSRARARRLRVAAPRTAAPDDRASPQTYATPLAARLAAAVVLLASLAYMADRGWKYGHEFLNADSVLATNSGYPLYQQANLNAQRYGPRLVQIGFENGIYFFRGTVIGDWFGPGRYRDLLQCEPLPCRPPEPARLHEMLSRFDARMLLLNRQLVTGLDETSLRAGGWQVLAADAHGVLLAAPGTKTPDEVLP